MAYSNPMPIPRYPDDITAEWLSAVLGGDTPVQLSGVDVVGIGTGQTGATYRVSVTYRGESSLPDTFVIKLPAQDDTVRDRVTHRLPQRMRLLRRSRRSRESADPAVLLLRDQPRRNGLRAASR